ncbi:MAG: arylsulfatase [Niabella sp.]
MKKVLFSVLAIGIASMLLFSFDEKKREAVVPPDDRPNIVLIMADDLGFSDVGCYGGEIRTPNIDYLAQNGLRFTQFYNNAKCCPTRASLLTGLYSHQAGIGEMTSDRGIPGYRGHITSNTVTIAEVLKTAGYQTAMSGKWHVANTVEQPTKEEHMKWLNHQANYSPFVPEEQHPSNRGFQKFFGTLWALVDYYDPFSLEHGSTPIENVPEHYYHTDAINDTAAAFIRQMSRNKQPFFLYVAQNAPHWPLQALPEDIEKYKDTYKVGWDAIREARYKRMVKMGLIDPATEPLSPRWNDDLSWEQNPDKEWDARAMAVHAAMVDRMDQGIGRIIQALKETGKFDNTIIIFLSDNGASGEVAERYGPGFDRFSETRDGRKVNYTVDKKVMPGPETTFSSIGPRWANVVNSPYRFWKGECYEGGIHTPMVVYWPKGLKTKKGGFTNQVGHVMDFMPTFIDLAHGKYPQTFNGHEILPMQGISLLPILKGKERVGHKLLFNEHFGAKYARKGEWKIVAQNGKKWCLYNIADDETELHDLAAQYPEKVKELDALWQVWAKDNHVLPKNVKKN